MVVVWLVDFVFIGNCLKSVIGYGIYHTIGRFPFTMYVLRGNWHES
jgi:hypothetical protein